MSIARKFMRKRSHVTGALHIVLTSERVHTHPGTTNVTGSHRQIGHRHHHGGTLRVLGDPKAIINRAVASPGIGLCRLTDSSRGYPSGLLEGFRAVLGQGDKSLPRPEGLNIATLVDKFFGHPPLCHHHVSHGINHGDIGAGTKLQMMLCADVW